MLDGEHDAEFVAECAQPVVPIGEHGDLAVIADLEEFLRAAMHVADDGVGAHDPFAVEDDLETEHAVRGRVLGADVEHHVV